MRYQSSQEKAFFEDNTGPIFMGAQRNSKDCKVGLYGVPYDGTTSFKPGARFGPNSIREVSNGLETYCPQLNSDLEDLKYVDFGSIQINHGSPEPVLRSVKKSTQNIFELGLNPLMLGGEHSITIGAVSAAAELYPDLVLLQLDAHADLRDEWLGSKNNHACTIRRCLEVLPSKEVLQVGIRSGTRKEFFELNDKKRLIPHEVGRGASHLEKALERFYGQPIYITIDLDWFDPSVLPGTGTPEPGGFYWRDFAAIIDVIKKHNIVAGDVVELAPQIDISGISSVLAAKVVRSLIIILSNQQDE